MIYVKLSNYCITTDEQRDSSNQGDYSEI